MSGILPAQFYLFRVAMPQGVNPQLVAEIGVKSRLALQQQRETTFVTNYRYDFRDQLQIYQ